MKPIILLAFANESIHKKARLKYLAAELQGIREALDRAHRLCEIIMLPDATLQQIIQTFQDQRYRRRITIFHYAGHADDFGLLLKTFSGDTAKAHKKGFTSFLSRQDALKLVFLNACSTQQHAIDLIEAGIPAVIGTSQDIDDKIATTLAQAFYKGIAAGLTLQRSWRDAIDLIKTTKGENSLISYYRYGSEFQEGNFPWIFRYKDGAHNMKQWNLPQAANQHLFDLPSIPAHYQLPDTPYIFLQRYQPEHAPVFFGRSKYIRDLYNRVTHKYNSPVILLNGQSGVGKSSLLEAGLLPRLEESHILLCLRRDPLTGLTQTLETALAEQLDSLMGILPVKSAQMSVENKWRSIESTTRKPLLVILDQVEEAFTTGVEASPNELDALLTAINPLFKNAADYPSGKLILSYRKEYDSEIQQQFTEKQIGYANVFVLPLNPSDIIEVVTGLTHTNQLQEKYNLKVEQKLPPIIARDLSKDANSPIAPTLQIIMTRLWDSSILDNASSHRCFTVKNYHRLQQDGLLMEDFFNRQMQQLESTLPHAVNSGLALALLHYHVTPLATSCSRHLDLILETFNHHTDLILDLLLRLKALYLLTNSRQDNTSTSLAHDTLAPIVIHQFNTSEKPGQRAARILAAKINNSTKENSPSLLDKADLHAVQQGLNGMRVLSARQNHLLQQSRREIKKRTLKAKRDRILRWVAAIVIIVSIIVFVWSRQQDQINRANNMALDALIAAPYEPTQALAMAASALSIHKNRIVTRSANTIYRENNFYKTIVKQTNIVSEHFSNDGNFILTTFRNGSAQLMGRQGTPIAALSLHTGKIESARFSPLGHHLLTASIDGTARLWDTNGNHLYSFQHNSPVTAVAFSPDQNRIITGTEDKVVHIWDRKGKSIKQLQGFDNSIRWLCQLQRPSAILIATQSGTIYKYRPRKKGHTLQVLITLNGWLHQAVLSPDQRKILTASKDKPAILWDIEGNQLKQFTPQAQQVSSVSFSPDGYYVLTGSADNTACLWDLQGKLLQRFRGHTRDVTSVGFSGDQKYIFTGSADDTIRIWQLKSIEQKAFRKHNGPVYCARFSAGGHTFFTASKDHALHCWDTQGHLINTPIRLREPITAVALSPGKQTHRQLILTGTSSGKLRLSLPTGKEVWKKRAHNKKINSISFSYPLSRLTTNPTLLSASDDCTAKLFDLQGKPLVTLAKHSMRVNQAVFSPDNQTILTASHDKTIRMWNRKGDQLLVFKGHTNFVHAVVFSPDGEKILSASSDKTARLWNLEGKILQVFRGHKKRIQAVAFHPDGKTIVTASYDNTIGLWDLNGNQLQLFNAHSGPVLSVAFSPDGHYVLSGSFDSTARLWKVTTVQEFLKKGLYQKFLPQQLGPVSRLTIKHADGVSQ